MNSAVQRAIFMIAIMLGYVIIDNHVSMQPLNRLDLAGPQFKSTLTAVIPFSLTIAALVARSKIGIKLGLVWAAAWFLLQVRQWWIPYLFGETMLHSNFDWYAGHGYSDTRIH